MVFELLYVCKDIRKLENQDIQFTQIIDKSHAQEPEELGLNPDDSVP